MYVCGVHSAPRVENNQILVQNHCQDLLFSHCLCCRELSGLFNERKFLEIR